MADWLEVIEVAWADQSMSATSVISTLGHQGIPIAKKHPFKDSTCLLYNLLYLSELGWMRINYLEASWMLEATGYLGLLSLFFVLTEAPWPRRFLPSEAHGFETAGYQGTMRE